MNAIAPQRNASAYQWTSRDSDAPGGNGSARQPACAQQRIELAKKLKAQFDGSGFVSQFIERQFHNLAVWLNGESFPIHEVELHLSSPCSPDWRHCNGPHTSSTIPSVYGMAHRITTEKIDRIVNGILAFNRGAVRIERVRFSALMGEPLVERQPFIQAARRLVAEGLKVDLCTNAFQIDPEDRELLDLLMQLSSIDIRLGAGCDSTCKLQKRPRVEAILPYKQVIANIEMLSCLRLRNGKGPRLNVDFVITPKNYRDIPKATADVFGAGAHSIRFRMELGSDLTGWTSTSRAEAEALIERVEERYHWPASFSIQRLFDCGPAAPAETARFPEHLEHDCPFANFFSTIASDGKVYLCDCNACPAAVALGDALREDLGRIWPAASARGTEKAERCAGGVCPLAATALNPFLRACRAAVREYGYGATIRALEQMRIGNQLALSVQEGDVL